MVLECISEFFFQNSKFFGGRYSHNCIITNVPIRKKLAETLLLRHVSLAFRVPDLLSSMSHVHYICSVGVSIEWEEPIDFPHCGLGELFYCCVYDIVRN